MKATEKNPQFSQSSIVNSQSSIATHPLKAWLDHWKVSTEDLSKATKRMAPPGLHDSFIRYIYREGSLASKKSVLKLSKATGIPPEILMFPERFPDFNPEEYKPENIIGQASCLTIQT